MPKRSKFLLLALCLTLSGSLWAFREIPPGQHTECLVRANNNYNVFHCRPVDEGEGDWCMPDGTGPWCAETVLTPI